MHSSRTTTLCLALLSHLTLAAGAAEPASPNQARWDELARFAPLMAAPTEQGRWEPALAQPDQLADLTDPQLRAIAGRLPRLQAIIALGQTISAQGSLNEQNLAELGALGLRRFAEQALGDTQGQQLTELEFVAKIAEMGVAKLIGSYILDQAHAERAEILSILCSVADALAGPDADELHLRFEVWQEPGSRESGLRATNLGDADLPAMVLHVASTLRGQDAPIADVIYVESWPTGATITLPTRLAGITTAHAPRLAHDTLHFSAWGPETSWRDYSLDMPGYARDQRVPPPNSVASNQRPVTARYMLLDDAYAAPRPDVIDPNGEPVPGWDRVPIRPTHAMQASRAIRGVFDKFRCGGCNGTGTVTTRVPRYGPSREGQPFRPVIGYDEVIETCKSCDGQKYSKAEGGDGTMDGFVRAASGVSPDDQDYDGVQSAIREEIASVLAINPSHAPTRLNTRAREHLSNGRLRPATPIWFVATTSQDITADSGEVFRAATMAGTPGTLVALELPTFDAAGRSDRCIVGGLYDGHIRLNGGRVVPVLRGAFRIGP